MPEYLSINWCPNNLRPYESAFSFLVRFCVLNQTTIQDCEDYFRIPFSGSSFSGKSKSLTDDDIQHIAKVLSEELSLVKTVFSPTVTLDDCQKYSLPKLPESNPEDIIYCEECVAQGYHSYIHELGWLSKCPFHGKDLQRKLVLHGSGKKLTQRFKCFQDLMQTHCKEWPWTCCEPFRGHHSKRFKLLHEWAKNANLAASRFSAGEIWQSNADMDISLADAVGRLRTLTPVPKNIESLFTEIGQPWHVEIRPFPRHVAHDLSPLLHEPLRFSKIFSFYKNISVRSSMPPPFVEILRTAIEMMRAKHGKCRCQWGLEKLSFNRFHWVKVHPDVFPFISLTCPYDYVFKMLEMNWGRRDRYLSYGRAQDEELELNKFAHEMHELGFVGYTPGAHVSPLGFLFFPQPVSPSCEWIDKSPLTDLFNAMAECEVTAALNNVSVWLDSIKPEQSPEPLEDGTDFVRLRERDEGLSLLKWSKIRTNNS